MNEKIDWLKVCKKIGEKVSEALMLIYRTHESRKEVGMGAGGDMTILADKTAEDIVIAELEKLDTCVNLISEERGLLKCGRREKPMYTVVVDPLDGSFNFKNGIDYFCISIAVLDSKGKQLLGYIKNLTAHTEYYALTGEGAFKNGERIRVARSTNAKNILLECSSKSSRADIEFLAKAFLNSRHSRGLGAVAMDFCLVADGTFDALFYAGASRYLDVAAGIFILEEAGGIVSDFNGNKIILKEHKLIPKNILACASVGIQRKLVGRRFQRETIIP